MPPRKVATRLALGVAAPLAACGFPHVTFTSSAPDTGAEVATVEAGDPPEAGDDPGDASVSGPSAEASENDGSPIMAGDAGPLPDVTAPDIDASGPDADAGARCDCGVLDMYPTFVTSCGLLGTGLACLSPGGFAGNPACGEVADYVTCDLGLGCTAIHSMKRQECVSP